MSKEKKKPSKIKARLPLGFTDREAAELSATHEMVENIKQVYEFYGFEAIETPAIEYTDSLGKFLPDADRPNEGVFSFQDEDKQWMSLRYDLTAPLARHVAQNYQFLAKPYRSYRYGWVFRNEKPGAGRFRQFMQFDADTVGAATVAADAEMCMMAADTMEAVGIERGLYSVKVSNRKVLDGVMEAIGLRGPENFGRRLTVLRAIDKLDRLGLDGVIALLGAGREDDSGDFTPGAKLSDLQIVELVNFLSIAPTNYSELDPRRREPQAGDRFYTDSIRQYPVDNFATIDFLRQRFVNSSLYKEGVEELAQISNLAERSDYRTGQIIIDPSVVRGLEYYTGPVYEVELLAKAQDEKGRPIRFGSVGGGGRYDGLVGRFGVESTPATGFSIGVSRLLSALQTIGKIKKEVEFGPILVTVFNKEFFNKSFQLLNTLRRAKIRAEIYLGNPKNMSVQLKYADRRNSPFAIIQGPDEAATGQVQIKDLAEGKRASTYIQSNEEWRHSVAGKHFVLEEQLVEEIIHLLSRYGIRPAINL